MTRPIKASQVKPGTRVIHMLTLREQILTPVRADSRGRILMEITTPATGTTTSTWVPPNQQFSPLDQD